jgi:hypothetical protein
MGESNNTDRQERGWNLAGTDHLDFEEGAKEWLMAILRTESVSHSGQPSMARSPRFLQTETGISTWKMSRC